MIRRVMRLASRAAVSRAAPKDRVALGAALAVIASALAVWSHQATYASDNPAADPTAYLEKISTADTTPYHARQLVVYMGHPQSAAVLDIRSAPKATFVRSDAGADTVRLWRRPGIGIVAAARGSVSDEAPNAPALRVADVLAKYEITTGPAQKMLGVDVVPLTLLRRSDQIQVERMWVNPASGVVYRRELFGAGGQLVGMSTIIDMHWGERAAAERYEPGTLPAARALVTDKGAAPVRLPYGYDLSSAYTIRIGRQQTTQWVYSDGLHALSVFATRDGLRAPRGYVASTVAGAATFTGPGPGTWAWEGGGYTWVLVAEEPDLDPSGLLALFPHGTPSAWSRMGSVWSKAFGFIGHLLS